MTPAEARFGGRRERRVLLGGGLVFGVMEPGEAAVQLAHQLAIGAFHAYIAFETIHFSALLLTGSL